MLDLRAHILLSVLLYFSLWHAVSANTEIINFEASADNGADVLPWLETVGWPKLSYAHPEMRKDLQPASFGTALHSICSDKPFASRLRPREEPCPHELWIHMDLDDEKWKQYSKFTLRLSYPASSPADFSIDLYSSVDLLNQTQTSVHQMPSSSAQSPSEAVHVSSLPSTPSQQGRSLLTRCKVARIRVVHTGIYTPSSSTGLLPSNDEPVPFIVVLEPLYVGILPASVQPILLFLLPLVTLAIFVIPWINLYLEEIASQARSEIAKRE